MDQGQKQVLKNAKSDKIAQVISKVSVKSGKTYKFDEKHNKNIPAQWWFQNSKEGLVLFIVFYTQACRWSRCLGCNLPSKASQFHVDWKDLWAQVDWLFSNPEIIKKRKKIKKVIVSNNGSVLDEITFSSTVLIYFVANLNKYFPNLAFLTLETRAEYVDFVELEFLSKVLKEGYTPTALELAVGFEAFDERIRNDIFHKGLTLKKFEDFVKKVAHHNFSVKCYFMQKPVPGMTDEEAIQDVKNAIDYLDELSRKYNIKINMHLNPTFVASGTALEESFKRGKYEPPKLVDVAKAVIHAENKNISIFLGLYDEGLAVKDGSFIREGDEKIVKQLEKFNKTQNYDILHEILRERRKG